MESQRKLLKDLGIIMSVQCSLPAQSHATRLQDVVLEEGISDGRRPRTEESDSGEDSLSSFDASDEEGGSKSMRSGTHRIQDNEELQVTGATMATEFKAIPASCGLSESNVEDGSIDWIKVQGRKTRPYVTA